MGIFVSNTNGITNLNMVRSESLNNMMLKISPGVFGPPLKYFFFLGIFKNNLKPPFPDFFLVSSLTIPSPAMVLIELCVSGKTVTVRFHMLLVVTAFVAAFKQI